MDISPRDQEAYNDLACYTLSHPHLDFLHQLVVDAFAAQHADETSKPIYTAFALMGLYLHNEHGFSGKQVQLAHMRVAKQKNPIPRFALPPDRGAITIQDVLGAEPDAERDAAIEQWSACTWTALSTVHREVAEWLKQELGVPTNWA